MQGALGDSRQSRDPAEDLGVNVARTRDTRDHAKTREHSGDLASRPIPEFEQ